MNRFGNLRYAGADFRREPRLTSLYSDFRTQRESNPDGYIANCTAWVNALAFLAEDAPNRFVMQVDDRLAKSVQSPTHGIPLALGAAIQHGVDTGSFMPLKQFKDARSNIHSKSRIPSTQELISWGLSTIGLRSKGSHANEFNKGELVVISALQENVPHVMKAISRLHLSNTALIFSHELWQDVFGGQLVGFERVTREEYDILMTYMSRDQSLASYDAQSGVVKFKSDSETAPKPITKEDIDIASLRTLISTIEKKISELDKRVAELDREVRSAVIAKNNLAAKNALRSKKLAEATLRSRTAMLHQLQDVYTKIEQAADQVDIVRVMETAGRTLKTLNEQTGGVDKIHDIMDNLKEEMANSDEIGAAINQDSAAAVDEDEVEDELEALEQAEQAKQTQADKEKEEAELEQEAEETRKMLAALESPTKAAFKDTTREQKSTEPSRQENAKVHQEKSQVAT